jgi:hypothetical protein
VVPVLLDPPSYRCPVCGGDVTGLVQEELEERVDVGYWRRPGGSSGAGSAWQEFEIGVRCPGTSGGPGAAGDKGHALTVTGKFIP